jgi:hypothetical protein
MIAAGKEKFMVHWTRKFFEYQLHHPFYSDFLDPCDSHRHSCADLYGSVRESAKFQAPSVFIDDVGFTTNESEKAVTPPV